MLAKKKCGSVGGQGRPIHQPMVSRQVNSRAVQPKELQF